MESKAKEFIHDLYLEHAPALFARAFYAVADVELAEEMVQETFLVAIYKIDEVMAHKEPAAFLQKTMTHMIKRQHKRKSLCEIPMGDDMFDVEDSNAYSSLENVLPRRLSPEERRLIMLRYKQKCSYQEIADELGISSANARIRMHRLIKSLRELLKVK